MVVLRFDAQTYVSLEAALSGPRYQAQFIVSVPTSRIWRGARTQATTSYTVECVFCATWQLDKSSSEGAYAATLHTKIISINPWALSDMASNGTHAELAAVECCRHDSEYAYTGNRHVD